MIHPVVIKSLEKMNPWHLAAHGLCTREPSREALTTFPEGQPV